jgi:hypothetical protein
MIKSITSFSFTVLFSTLLNAQTQGFSYTAVGKGYATTAVTDYHSLGINVSALGWGTGYEGKKFTMGLTEFGAGIYSDSLNSDKLRNLYKTIRTSVQNGNTSNIDWQKQQAAAADYAEAGLTIFANYNWFGAAYQHERFGGIAINISENYRWYSKFNERTTDLLFRGKLADYFDSLTVVFNGDTTTIANSINLSEDTLSAVIQGTIAVPLNLSEITKGSTIRASWNRHYSFGYGRKLFGNDSSFAVYGGIGGRFIQSVAMFNMESTDDGLFMYASMSPNFNIDYGNVALTNSSSYTQKGSFLPSVVGNGYGIDLAVSVKFFGKLKVSAAVNNIGQVTYKRNVYRVNDTLLTTLRIDGLSDYNVTQSVNQLLKNGGLLSLVGEEKYTVENPADFRLGASMEFGQRFKIGADFVAPFDRNNPGSFANPVISCGAEIRPVKWLALSAGYFGGGIYKSNVPVGINFILKNGTYEFGISSYDALSFFMKDSNSISAAFGCMRFRF